MSTGRPFTLEDARKMKFVRNAGFIGGGTSGFFTVTQISDELNETNTLWVFGPDGSDQRPVEAQLVGLSDPTPSPDGSMFAVAAEIDDRRQIFLLPVNAGDVRQLTSLPQGVGGGFAWSPDGRSIAFTAGPEPRDLSLPYRVDRVTYRVDGLGYLDDAVQDIFVVDVGSGPLRQLTSDRCMNSNPRWSPDARSLSYLVSFDPDREARGRNAVHVLDVESGKSRVVIDGEWGAIAGAVWNRDGERIVFLGLDAAGGYFGPRKWDLWSVAAEGGEPECRTTGLPTSLLPLVQTDLPIDGEIGPGRICVRSNLAYVSGQVRGDIVICRVALSGPKEVETIVATPDLSAYLYDVDADGRILYQSTSTLEPPNLMLDSTKLTSLNDGVIGEVLRPELRTLDITAPDGVRSEGWVLTPPGEGTWPTVLYIHGGPYGAFGSTYSIDFHLLVSAGFAVIFHNFRGSAGYGEEFSSKIVGAWGPAGAIDHHAALDAAIEAGFADPDRLGVCGLSYGGFATCWLVGTSDRFKAAVAENQNTSRASSFGVTDMPWYVAEELGGPPWELPDVYAEQSPLTHAPKCRTPVLFVVGEADMRCDHTESEQFYRVLKANGVTTEMLRLPNSSHMGTINGPVPARIAQNEALVDWFQQHLAHE